MFVCTPFLRRPVSENHGLLGNVWCDCFPTACNHSWRDLSKLLSATMLGGILSPPPPPPRPSQREKALSPGVQTRFWRETNLIHRLPVDRRGRGSEKADRSSLRSELKHVDKRVTRKTRDAMTSFYQELEVLHCSSSLYKPFPRTRCVTLHPGDGVLGLPSATLRGLSRETLAREVGCMRCMRPISEVGSGKLGGFEPHRILIFTASLTGRVFRDKGSPQIPQAGILSCANSSCSDWV